MDDKSGCASDSAIISIELPGYEKHAYSQSEEIVPLVALEQWTAMQSVQFFDSFWVSPRSTVSDNSLDFNELMIEE